jgi:hypothetical protein
MKGFNVVPEHTGHELISIITYPNRLLVQRYQMVRRR